MKTGTFVVRHGDQSHRVSVAAGGQATIDGAQASLDVAQEAPSVYRVDDGSTVRRIYVVGSGEARQVFVEGEAYDFHAGPETGAGRRPARAVHDLLEAPMPARVTAILAEPGQAVRKGDVLLKLEAMKMELAVRAPRDGTVTSISCLVGELVQPGVGLLEIA